MATAVETFMTLGENSRTTARQSANPTEVIDVDLFSDDDVRIAPPAPRPRPRPRLPRLMAGPSRVVSGTSTPETIDLVDDSDEEGPSTSSGRRVERRRLFSPPPRMNGPIMLIPPVPRVPAQYAGHTSMVPRAPSRLIPPPPPPVRAADRAFQLNVGRTASPAAGPSNRQPQAAAPQSAPRSHHVPSLGLGGALISDNRARLAAERRAGIPRSQHVEGFAPNVIRHVFTPLGARFSSLFGRLGQAEQEAMDEEEAEYYEFLMSQNRFRHPPPEPEHYKPFYTHPLASEPGFTNDFAPEESGTDGPSTFPQTSKTDPIIILDDDDDDRSAAKKEDVKTNTLLVCARCSDPLVLNSGLTGTDASTRRIWALRCGHLIDGKCLSEIGQPCAITNDRKGKGKAKEEIPYGEEDPARSGISQQHDTDEGVDPTPEPPSQSIRSRLRSHTSSHSLRTPTSNGAPSLDDPHSAATATLTTSATTPGSASRKRKRAPTKAAANKKPKVEAEYEWRCPVASCNRIHASVKVNGVWGPEKERQLKKGPLVDLELSPRGVLAVFA